jgi:hypothetical protein
MKRGYFIFQGVLVYEIACVHCTSVLSVFGGEPGGSQRAHVQRGESATARYASTFLLRALRARKAPGHVPNLS